MKPTRIVENSSHTLQEQNRKALQSKELLFHYLSVDRYHLITHLIQELMKKHEKVNQILIAILIYF